MKLIVLLMLLLNNAYAVMNEDCIAAVNDLNILVYSSTEIVPLNKIKTKYSETIATCRATYSRLESLDDFNDMLKEIEEDCDDHYSKFSYRPGALIEAYGCKAGELKERLAN